MMVVARTVTCLCLVVMMRTAKCLESIDRSLIVQAKSEVCDDIRLAVDQAKKHVEGEGRFLMEEKAVEIKVSKSCFVFCVGGEDLQKQLEAMDGVLQVERDHYVYAAEVRQTDVQSWGLDRIDQENGQLDQKYFTGFDGEGVDIYILDTGVRSTHNEFGGRATMEGRYDYTNEGLFDGNGHGTHCGGIAAGINVGAAKKANIIGVKVLDSEGAGTGRSIIRALSDIASQAQRPSVISMSLGGDFSSSTNNAAKAASDEGHIVVVAAGNTRDDACNHSPAAAGGQGADGGVITVSSSDSQDRRSSFSSFGRCCDIFAPGTDIISSYHTTDQTYARQSGTSMATPFVAGVAAQYLQKHSFNKTAAVQDMFSDAVAGKIASTTIFGTPNLLIQAPELAAVINPTVPPSSSPTVPPSSSPTLPPPSPPSSPPNLPPSSQTSSQPPSSALGDESSSNFDDEDSLDFTLIVVAGGIVVFAAMAAVGFVAHRSKTRTQTAQVPVARPLGQVQLAWENA